MKQSTWLILYDYQLYLYKCKCRDFTEYHENSNDVPALDTRNAMQPHIVLIFIFHFQRVPQYLVYFRMYHNFSSVHK